MNYKNRPPLQHPASLRPSVLTRRFLEGAVEACGIKKGASILVAVSGGPDSVALLAMFMHHAPAQRWRVSAAHYNHRVRGRAADADERFARELCRRWGAPLAVGRRRSGRAAGNEEALRELRLAFLEGAGRKVSADYVATGHQRNDLAETFLMRLLRGAGGEGLASIAPRAERDGITLVRPLLQFHRKDIEKWLSENGVPFRTDATNALLERTRSRVRMELMPHLARRYNPNVVEDLARTAEILREENLLLDAMASTGATSKNLSVSRLRRQPLALRRRAVRQAVARAKGDLRRMAFAHVESVLHLLDGGRETHLPGWLTVRREDDILKFLNHDTKRATSRTRRPRSR